MHFGSFGQFKGGWGPKCFLGSYPVWDGLRALGIADVGDGSGPL